MKRKYKQLSLSQRYVIEMMLKQNKKIKEISLEIGVSPSTINREIKRNGSPIYGKYTAEQAQKRRDERRKNSNKKPIIESNPCVEKYIREELEKGRSPDMIEKRGRLEKEAGLLKEVPFIPCKETIYSYIYRCYKEKKDITVLNYLRTKKKKRRKRISQKKQRGVIKDRVFIDQRLQEVNERVRIGDWEIDTIEGKGHKGVIVSMLERASRLLLLKYVPSKSAKEVCASIMNALRPFQQIGAIKTITFDNGKEFALHYLIAKKWNIQTFFTHPYSAWQKGSVERFNKEVRHYIPQKTPFTSDIIRQLSIIQDKINNLPRKVLGYLTLYEYFFYFLNTKNYSLNLKQSKEYNLVALQSGICT